MRESMQIEDRDREAEMRIRGHHYTRKLDYPPFLILCYLFLRFFLLHLK